MKRASCCWTWPVSGSNSCSVLDLVVEQRDADRVLGVLGREDVDHVAAHAERAAAELDVVALVLHLGQALDRVALRDLVALAQVQDHAVVLGRVADAVDRRHRRDDHARRGRSSSALGRRQAHLLDVLVDRGVLLDEQVARRHVGLGLVVVVVGDEVLDRVVRERTRGTPSRAAPRASCSAPAPAPAGPVRAITLAMVKVLPDPVTPSSVWKARPSLDALDQLVDRLRLVAGGRERLVQLGTGCWGSDEPWR